MTKISPGHRNMLLPLRPVPFERVTFTDNFWASRQKLNHEVSIPHNLETTRGLIRDLESLGEQSANDQCGPSGNQQERAGPSSDMFVHNLTEALAAAVALTPDKKLQAELDRRIAIVAAAQDDDGYLHSLHQIHSHRRWHDIDGHELFVGGHLMEAAATHFRLTGKKTLLTAATRLADHAVAKFKAGEVGFDRSGHPGVEMGLAKLYDVSGEKEYIDLARCLVEYGRHAQYINDAQGEGHAVRATNFFAGMADVALRTGDQELLATADRVWRDMVNRKMYITGGLGEVCTVEGFHLPYELSDKKSNAELCATMGNVFLSHRLFLGKADACYIDVLEQALYNGVLVAGGLDGENLFYSGTLFSRADLHRGPGVWCCPTNWCRFIPQVSGLFYAVSDNEIYVNLYAANRAEIKLSGQLIKIRQTTDFPWQPQVKFEVSPSVPADFTLKLRVPGWSSSVAIAVNGKEIDDCPVNNGYLALCRKWQAGDRVELLMSMPVQRLEANPQIATARGRVALRRGPVLYCFEAVDNGGKVTDLALPPDAEVKWAYEPELLGGVVTLSAVGRRRTAAEWKDQGYRMTTPEREVTLKAIPFYAWDNRHPGEMQLWIPETTLLAEDPLRPTIALDAETAASVETAESQIESVNDGLYPAAPGRSYTDITPFRWEDRTGTEEWVSLDFGKPVEIFAVEVYWYDRYFELSHDWDPYSACWAPESWRVEYLDSSQNWQTVRSPSDYCTDQVWFSRVNFEPVRTSAVRIVAQLKEGKSAGINEVRVLENTDKPLAGVTKYLPPPSF